MTDYGKHYSVLKNEVNDFFASVVQPDDEANLADLTFGAGGHTFSFAEKFSKANIFSCDQDEEAFNNGVSNIEKACLENRVKLYRTNFKEFHNVVPQNIMFSGVLLDAGVSSHQFDSGERGFSFRFDAPLDMRMNQTTSLTAKDIVNNYEASELEQIIFDYGEERFGKTIVKNILEARDEKPIETTKELESICFHSYPKKMRFEKTHPATKTFQALRIAVNDELGVLSDVITQIIPRLEIGGIFAIISFHSLEDRIVKRAFRSALNGEIPLQILTKKPIIPSDQEIFENSRSRSAKLRVIKRVKEWPKKNKYPRDKGVSFG
jgi:16S rRNA (cytosine1402-N4)-methyltransferase